MRFDTIINADCIEWLHKRRKPFADLIFADPPFNIGYKYDVYEDRKAYDEYYEWTRDWMTACEKKLNPAGSMWVAIGDEYAAEVKQIGDNLGLHLRNWIIWHYTFGQNTKRKFARSHAHVFYWVKDRDEFTFNPKAVTVFSDRQREYHDKRARKTVGKVPDDVWSEYPRVCGTFGERAGWHPCQMPETMLARIVRVATRSGDVVFDPFAGSGTTLAVAKKLGRKYMGTEISPAYCQEIRKRLSLIRPLAEIAGKRPGPWPEVHVRELQNLYVETQVPTDALRDDEYLRQCFAEQFRERLEIAGSSNGYAPEEILAELMRLRKNNALGRIRVHAAETGPRRRRARPEVNSAPTRRTRNRAEEPPLFPLEPAP